MAKGDIWTDDGGKGADGWFFVEWPDDGDAGSDSGFGIDLTSEGPLPQKQPLSSYVNRNPMGDWQPYAGDPKPVLAALQKRLASTPPQDDVI